MSWIETDRQLEADGWNLLLMRHHEQWRCHYDHVAHLPCAAVGKIMVDVIHEAQTKILEGR
jgi:hypothetical protein